jgi:hypothetical protein
MPQKMQKQTHFPASPRSGPEALRRASKRTMSIVKSAKTNPLRASRAVVLSAALGTWNGTGHRREKRRNKPTLSLK